MKKKKIIISQQMIWAHYTFTNTHISLKLKFFMTKSPLEYYQQAIQVHFLEGMFFEKSIVLLETTLQKIGTVVISGFINSRGL